METAQEEFQIRVYLKTELAQLYAPHLDPEAALRKMRKWIHRNPVGIAFLFGGQHLQVYNIGVMHRTIVNIVAAAHQRRINALLSQHR